MGIVLVPLAASRVFLPWRPQQTARLSRLLLLLLQEEMEVCPTGLAEGIRLVGSVRHGRVVGSFPHDRAGRSVPQDRVVAPVLNPAQEV